MDKQQGPAVEHRGLCSMLRGSVAGGEPGGQRIHVCSMLRGSLAGGESGGERIHVCVWLSPFAVDLKLSQSC